jgi:hypothetical protein
VAGSVGVQVGVGVGGVVSVSVSIGSKVEPGRVFDRTLSLDEVPQAPDELTDRGTGSDILMDGE